MAVIQPSWKCCATCTRWMGHAQVDFAETLVEYEDNEHATCSYWRTEQSCMVSCFNWKQRWGNENK